MKAPSKQGYTGPRPDVLKMIEAKPHRILDVGCGGGTLGQSIKAKWPAAKVIGVDGDPTLLEQAATRLDKTYRIDLNLRGALANLPEGDFDLIIFADVLEHTMEPERILREALALLGKDGNIITSIPNIRHYSTLISLGVAGTWPRRDRGIHDRTHIRFFTRSDIIRMLEECGLKPVKERRNVRLIESCSWTNIPGKILDFWPFRSFLTFQYLHRSVVNDTHAGI